MGKKKSIDRVLGYNGFVLEVFGAIAQAVIDKGGNPEDLKRLVSNPDLGDQVADFIVSQATPYKSSGLFSAHVDYSQPKFEELRQQFSGYINPDFRQMLLAPIERCSNVLKDNREVTFEYVTLDREASIDELLAETSRKNLRPALYEELLGFDKAYPDEYLKHNIYALGSEVVVNGDRNVASVIRCTNSDNRGLALCWVVDTLWSDEHRFLAVRE